MVTTISEEMSVNRLVSPSRKTVRGDGRPAGALAHQQPAVGAQQSSGVGDLVHANPPDAFSR